MGPADAWLAVCAALSVLLRAGQRRVRGQGPPPAGAGSGAKCRRASRRMWRGRSGTWSTRLEACSCTCPYAYHVKPFSLTS